MAQLNSTIVSGDMRVTDDMSATTVKSTRNNQLLIGTGTAASASGSTYYPAKWTFNTGITINNGDIITIKIPVAGHDYGVYVSIDNGSHYYPVVLASTGRLTTHFPVNNCITMIFESDGSCASIFPVAGGGSRVTVTGGAFRVINFYDSNSNNYDRNLYTGTIKCGSTAIVAGNIIVGKDGVFHHLKDGTAFDINYPILYANAAIAANSTGTNNYDVLAIATATTQTGTWTAYLPVYIKGTLSGNIFTPISTAPLTQTVPSAADGYYYILLGVAYSTTNIYLDVDHRIFAYKNGKFGEISNSAIYADIAGSATDNTKVAKAGDTMTGTLCLNTTTTGGYSEGIRINQGHGNWSTLLIGGTKNTTTGTNDGAFWIGTNSGNSSYIRKLWIGHNASYASNTYFIASSSSDVSPALNLGTSGAVSSGDTKAVTGGVVYTALTNGTVTKVGTGTVGGTTTPIYLNAGTPTALSYTIAKSVPSDAVFTDTKVTQTATTTDAKYEVLFSVTADNTTRTEGARKASTLRFNPGKGSLMEGSATMATGQYAHAEGYQTNASDKNAHAEGDRTVASGESSHAEGSYTTASNWYAHAEGSSTIASAARAHAEGGSTTAMGQYSHAEGRQTIADFVGHAEGDATSATGDYSQYAHAEGTVTYSANMASHAEGNGSSATGSESHSEGYQTKASGKSSHAEGYQTTASGIGSHAEGGYATSGGGTRASGTNSHAEGLGTTASGSDSHAEGLGTCANGAGSHAEGGYSTTSSVGTIASGENSHAEGYLTIASGDCTHAEGYNNKAIGSYSHSEGANTCAGGQCSHTEGYSTTASIMYSHAEGCQTITNGNSSHAEGYKSTAYGHYSHAEGTTTYAAGDGSHTEGYKAFCTGGYSHVEGHSSTASGDYTHAEGKSTYAQGAYSHSEGANTSASGNCSHAAGSNTTASNYASLATGHFNAAMTTGGTASNTTGTAMAIGNGIAANAGKNCFSVQYNGVVKAASTITASTTADYAEYFEWADANLEEEDRVGYFVTFEDEDKIRFATSEDDYILGITSGEPFVLGNGDCDVWNGMVMRDEFRRVIYEAAPEYEEVEGGRIPKLDKDGNPVYCGTRPVLNPDYDPTVPYVNRADRPEWIPVGMLGVLAVRDDGTCQVNGYATINDSGIATRFTSGNQNRYRVIKRKSQNVIEVIFR